MTKIEKQVGHVQEFNTAAQGEMDTIVRLIHKHVGVRDLFGGAHELTGVGNAADAILAACSPAATSEVKDLAIATAQHGLAELFEENAQLRAQVEKLHKCASLLFQNAVGCCENHHGLDIKLNGYPGWLRDIGRDIDSAQVSSTDRQK
ncbi:hypothetical protein ACVWZ4_007217 [Bradyrhizobium sp. USDA 4472]